ncbi:MAG: TIGR03620 family F420-dependent LLM class oxidoreductase [Pseudomonadales bacterium]|nr:TIGR03620 family F420-dependent LLM class oxidoreductase [Pseudomonadales bacterium]MDG1444396.1 TIGR03620 family F420-dependent LLM class oxidoreductase [Pseudomonadales bacterium]
MELNKLGVWYFLDGMPSSMAAETAKRIESLGYNTLWIPETAGRDPYASASWLLANTEKLNVATGIASIYHREPGVTVAGQKTLAEQSGDRFLLALGVSHQQFVEGVRKITYGKPVTTMRKYLNAMDEAPYMAFPPATEPKRLIAALGPRMLELARDKCAGAHPYFTSPKHTKMAREILGPDALLCVEQKVLLEADADIARKAARAVASVYMGLPNYRNNWLRMGLNESDFENGGSDRFIDETFAWGNLEQVRDRIEEHYAAGADHVCIQPVNPNAQFGDLDWNVLEKLSPNAN